MNFLHRTSLKPQLIREILVRTKFKTLAVYYCSKSSSANKNTESDRQSLPTRQTQTRTHQAESTHELITSGNPNNNKDSTLGGSPPNESSSREISPTTWDALLGVSRPSYSNVFGINANPTTGSLFGVNSLGNTSMPGAGSPPTEDGWVGVNSLSHTGASRPSSHPPMSGLFGVNSLSRTGTPGANSHPAMDGWTAVNSLGHTGMPRASSNTNTGGLFGNTNINSGTLSGGNSTRSNGTPLGTISSDHLGLFGTPRNANANNGHLVSGNPGHGDRPPFAGSSGNGTLFTSSSASNGDDLFRSDSSLRNGNLFRGHAPPSNGSPLGGSTPSNNGTRLEAPLSSSNGARRYPEVSLSHGMASPNADASTAPELIARNSTQPGRIQLPYPGRVHRPNWSIPNISNGGFFLGNSNINNGFGESPSSGSTSRGLPDMNIPPDEAIWRKWVVISGIDVDLIAKEFNRVYSSQDKKAFMFFRQELHVIFLTAGTSNSDATVARETFCFWALERYVAQRLAPVFT